MLPLVPVMIGGALGAGARYALGVAASRTMGDGFPWGTLLANLIGGLAMGVLAGVLSRTSDGETARLFLGVGVLGGFTTFSAFSLETWSMIERGHWGTASGYIAASVIGSVLLFGAGLWIARGA